MKTRAVSLAIAASMLGCGISLQDARDLSKGAAAAASTDPSMTLRILMASCGEIASCANGCSKALRFAGTVDDPSEQATVLASCFSDFRREHEQKGTRYDAWFVGYYREYAHRASEKLEPADRKALQTSLVQVGSNAPKGDALRELADPL